jgi:hypothetical protein
VNDSDGLHQLWTNSLSETWLIRPKAKSGFEMLPVMDRGCGKSWYGSWRWMLLGAAWGAWWCDRVLPLLRQEMTTVERGEGWYCGGGSYLLITWLGQWRWFFYIRSGFPLYAFFKDRLPTRIIPVFLFFYFFYFSWLDQCIALPRYYSIAPPSVT